ncbi:unnamed protein product [Blumeria hordei]|uniref:Uncharacterized protein n=1 Tax=Blumeria hordei TaxID=2867405 RepID=A0A383UNV2_BLUHO|nr:unnamed protein product [Blumeria hordei]
MTVELNPRMTSRKRHDKEPPGHKFVPNNDGELKKRRHIKVSGVRYHNMKGVLALKSEEKGFQDKSELK